MAGITLELAFDWDMASRGSAIGVFYQLQWSVVDNGKKIVISPVKRSAIRTGNTLDFCVYNITDPAFQLAPEPQCLQLLFNNAVDPTSTSPFTPIKDNVPQITLTDFRPLPKDSGAVHSVAFGRVRQGWAAEKEGAPFTVTLGNSGRFELRTMVTVAVADKIARYYQVDPEMIVGGAGG